jgi:murein L,D-transpeptidase YafK
MIESSFSIVIEKSKRALRLCKDESDGGRLIKTYRVALGSNPSVAKTREGDGATPEGEYYITHRNGASRYYLSLGISYPNANDAAQGYSAGVISRLEYEAIADATRKGERPLQKTALGGDIFLHGGGTIGDWTAGCVALENSDIKELFDSLPLRTRVTILP